MNQEKHAPMPAHTGSGKNGSARSSRSSRSSQSFERPLVWITGASSGIGEALAEQLFAKGYSLVLSARNEMKLQALKETLLSKRDEPESEKSSGRAAPSIHVLALDITDDEKIDHYRAMLADLDGELCSIYLCAGVCEYLDFPSPDASSLKDEIDWDMISRVHRVNFLGNVNCVNIALPLLKHHAELGQTRPHIVGLSSQAMLMPFTRAEAYGSSKAALHYFLLSLSMDLKRFNIDVTSVLPGFVETPMTKQNDFSMPFIMSATEAAERISKGVESRPKVFAFPKRLYLLLKFFSLIPGLWYKKMSPKQDAVE